MTQMKQLGASGTTSSSGKCCIERKVQTESVVKMTKKV